MKFLLFLFSGLLIACSNPALALTNCTEILPGNLVLQSIQMVTQLLNPLLTTASSISNTTGTAVAAAVSSLEMISNEGIPNLISALGNPLSEASTAAQKALESIQTPLLNLTNALTGVSNNTALSLSPTVLAALRSAFTNFKDLGSEIANALAGIGK